MIGELELLLAERAIARGLAAIARAMDQRDWQALEQSIAGDATGDFGIGTLTGRAAIVAQMRSFLDDCGPTQHLLGNLAIEIDADGSRARSRCYVSDLHLAAGERSQATFSTLGEYIDDWRRIDGRWWLVHRHKQTRAFLGSFDVLGPGPPGFRP